MSRVVRRQFCFLTQLDNRIYGVTGTIPRGAERRTGRREDGIARARKRTLLTLSWRAGRDDAPRG